MEIEYCTEAEAEIDYCMEAEIELMYSCCGDRQRGGVDLEVGDNRVGVDMEVDDIRCGVDLDSSESVALAPSLET